MIQFTVDQLLDKVTLHDLVSQENKSETILTYILEQNQLNARAERVDIMNMMNEQAR